MKTSAKMLPIISIHFQDHSADIEGEAKPFYFFAIGLVLKETAHGFTLGHWLDVTVPGKGTPEVSTYVAKVKGMKVTTLAHIVLE